jgi:hypothetical protein
MLHFKIRAFDLARSRGRSMVLSDGGASAPRSTPHAASRVSAEMAHTRSGFDLDEMRSAVGTPPLPDRPALHAALGAPPPGVVDLLIVVCNPTRAPLPKAVAEANVVRTRAEGLGKRVEVRHSCTADALRTLLAEEVRPRILLFIGHADAKFEVAQSA